MLDARCLAAATFLLLSPLLWSSAQADPPPGYPFQGYDTGLAQAKVQDKPVLLYFGRYGCAYCEYTNRKTFSDAGLTKLFSENYILVYVDAEGGKRIRLPSGERITEAELGTRLGAFATPLFVFMAPDGRIVAKIPGFKTVQDFQDYDRYVRGKHYENQSLMQFLSGKS
jgi:thioredoxin-related protein